MPVAVAPLASLFPVAASVLGAFAENGLRRILITSVLEGGGAVPHASTLPGGTGPRTGGWLAGFAQEAATMLASGGPDDVLVVQACPPRPDADRLRGLPTRSGLWELIHEAYLHDLTPERTASFGVGDWLEILDAQRRSGDLLIREGEEAILLRFVRGSIQAVACSARVPGAAAASEERARAGERIARILAARRPVVRFIEGAPSLALEADGASVDDLLGGRVRDLVPHPYLTEQIARRVTDTPLPNLKRITAGGGSILTQGLRRPLELLLSRLRRRFAFVLIDATTVPSAGSIAMLAGLADATLLVANVTSLDSAGLVRAVAELRRGGSGKVAVLLIPPDAAPESAR